MKSETRCLAICIGEHTNMPGCTDAEIDALYEGCANAPTGDAAIRACIAHAASNHRFGPDGYTVSERGTEAHNALRTRVETAERERDEMRARLDYVTDELTRATKLGNVDNSWCLHLLLRYDERFARWPEIADPTEWDDTLPEAP